MSVEFLTSGVAYSRLKNLDGGMYFPFTTWLPSLFLLCYPNFLSDALWLVYIRLLESRDIDVKEVSIWSNMICGGAPLSFFMDDYSILPPFPGIGDGINSRVENLPPLLKVFLLCYLLFFYISLAWSYPSFCASISKFEELSLGYLKLMDGLA